MTRLFGTFLCVFIISACSIAPSIQIHPMKPDSASTKQVVVFLDGTGNSRDSRTNIAALSEIVKNQDRDNLFMFYAEGVGTKGKVLGAATGWGIGNDIIDAYSFLSKYYSQNSKLSIFGFSRGAYASRILNGMINSVGIYDLSHFSYEDRKNIAKELYYDVYKSEYKGDEASQLIIKENINRKALKVIKSWYSSNELSRQHNPRKFDNVQVEVLGIWDTVEALGIVPIVKAIKDKKYDVPNYIRPNTKYLDTLCNVKNAFHAVSLDDNRAGVFTPIIITSNAMSQCTLKEEGLSISERKVDEVWFSGAHADVGGGYNKNDNYNEDAEGNPLTEDIDISLAGVSLNWMLKRIRVANPDLLPDYIKVYENALPYSHDSTKGSIPYPPKVRTSILQSYLQHSTKKVLKVHPSVIKRIKFITQKGAEDSLYGFNSYWYDEEPFSGCFDKTKDTGYEFKPGCKLIEISN